VASHYKNIISNILKPTPLHPQWIIYLLEKKQHRDISRGIYGTVLDIGCANQEISNYLEKDVNYIGLDYLFTASNWYKSKPDIFGDAHTLPIKSGSIDHILLLDVMEHLRNPDHALSEAFRTLKHNGKIIIQVPFMYPIHDAPLDFCRWTEHGVKQLLDRAGFKITQIQVIGGTWETIAIIVNIGLVFALTKWVKSKSIFTVLGIIFPFIIPVVNILAYLLSKTSIADTRMAHSYRVTCSKR